MDHTGLPTWERRAWAATLPHAPAALRAWGLTATEPTVVDLVVATGRRVDDPRGVRSHRPARLDALTQLHLGPPRVRLEHAVLDVASRAAGDDRAVAWLADAWRSRLTTARRLVEALESMPRLARRRLLLTVLDDVGAGACSALERRYLTQVERPHGLPTGSRQRRVTAGRAVAYRDVDFVDLLTLVELDGRLGHEKAGDR